MSRCYHKSLFFTALAAWLVGGLSPAMARSGSDILSQIDAAAASGKLTYETALLYKVRAIRSPHLLPEPFRSAASARPVKCGTPVMMEAIQAAPSLSASFQAEVADASSRPSTDSTYRSPRGHFLIHYDLVGVNSVSSNDLDSSGFPDFIENLALFFDSAWAYEVDGLGWGPPPSDGTEGGDSLYDVYPTSIGYTYGYTMQDSPGPAPWDDYSSYIFVHKAFIGFPPNDDPDGDQLGSMRVTAAHEFNHACQFADNPLHYHATESWWQEISATWMEDVVFDTVNDNYNFLDEFFPFPEISLFDGSEHKYGAFVIGKFIEENYGVQLVRESWEKMRWSSAVTSLDTAFMNVGSDFAETFHSFAGWNYFTESRDDGSHYQEGSRYLLVPITRVESSYPVFQRSGAVIQSMAADYIELLPDPAGRDVVELKFNGSNDIQWRAAVWRIDSAGQSEQLPIDIDTLTGDGTLYFGSFDQLDRAVLVVVNVERTPTEKAYNYSLDFLIRADCDFNQGADIFDVLYLIDFIYGSGPEPEPLWQVGDLNCSGGIDILDVSVIIDYILKGGETPCAPVD